jgi:hypothetical protein
LYDRQGLWVDTKPLWLYEINMQTKYPIVIKVYVSLALIPFTYIIYIHPLHLVLWRKINLPVLKLILDIIYISPSPWSLAGINLYSLCPSFKLVLWREVIPTLDIIQDIIFISPSSIATTSYDFLGIIYISPSPWSIADTNLNNLASPNLAISIYIIYVKPSGITHYSLYGCSLSLVIFIIYITPNNICIIDTNIYFTLRFIQADIAEITKSKELYELERKRKRNQKDRERRRLLKEQNPELYEERKRLRNEKDRARAALKKLTSIKVNKSKYQEY